MSGLLEEFIAPLRIVMTENQRIARAASTIGIGTLMSRILGFIRDMVIARFFGAGLAADAFFVAFRIPNLWRRLVGEGALTVSFIPVYSEYLDQHSENETREFAHIAFTMAGLALLVLVLLGVVFSPILVRMIAPGFMETPEKFELTVALNRIIFPYLFFMGLFAVCMGILNSLRHFFAPAVAPIFLNISMILSVLLFSRFFEEPVMALAVGVLAGGAVQLLFQIPFLRKRRITFRFNFNFRHPGIKRVGSLMIPGVIGTAGYQIGVFIDNAFASFLPTGSISYLFFADRLIEFPLGLFAIAIGMASLPSLSSLVSQGRMEELKETFSFSFRLVSFISIPAMMGLIFLKTPIVHLLFQRGQFDYTATAMTVKALLCYSVGLWAIAGVRTLVPVFYSLQDTWTPMKIALICLGVKVTLNAILIVPLKHAGLALATSLSLILNLILLFRKLHPRLGGIDVNRIVGPLLRITLSSLLMGLLAYFICSFTDWSRQGQTLQKAGVLGVGVGAGIVAYFACSLLLKNEEALFLVRMVRRRGFRSP
jgi:putative peptidoglycan lipid II flippase